VNISPVTDEYGTISHFVAIKEDITQKKKIIEELTAAKEKAEESDHLKSAFLANMSHEIRTPMNGILGFTELLSDSHFSGEEKQNFIKIIQKSGQRMLNTVNDLIDISKIETGQMSVVLAPANVKEILFSQYSFFEPEAEEKKLNLVLNDQLQQSDALVLTDVVKLDSVLTNLIKNALKYTDFGTVEIGCNKQNNQLNFYVKDTGIGIPENRQAAVFNRFEQADVGDKRAYQGSGLGLTIAKAYVEMLGGKMELDSKVGFGSTFRFYIPASEPTGNCFNESEQIKPEEKPEVHSQ
jgi:signal transduction histidine kinase